MTFAEYQAGHPAATIGASTKLDRVHLWMLGFGLVLFAVAAWLSLSQDFLDSAGHRKLKVLLGSLCLAATGLLMAVNSLKLLVAGRSAPGFGWALDGDELFVVGSDGDAVTVAFVEIACCKMERGPGRVTKIELVTADEKRAYEISRALRRMIADDRAPGLDGLWAALEPRLRTSRPDLAIEVVQKRDNFF